MSCSVGESISEVCVGVVEDREALPTKKQDLIRLRSECDFKNVCSKHKDYFLNKFPLFVQNSCYNPLGFEHNSRGRDLKVVTYDYFLKYKDIQVLVPGKKICRSCRDHLFQRQKAPLLQTESEVSQLEIMDDVFGPQSLLEDQGPPILSPPHLQRETPQSSPAVGHRTPHLSPAFFINSPRVQALKDEGSSSEAGSQNSEENPLSQNYWATPEEKKNWEKIKDIGKILNITVPESKEVKSKNRVRLILADLQEALKLLVYQAAGMTPKFSSEENPIKVPIDYKDTCFDIFSQMKEKLSESKSIEERVHILSLAPKDWSAYHLRMEFEVGRKLSEKVKSLVAVHGILPPVNPRAATKHIDEVAKKVREFYYSPEISREMPGMRDVKSVKENGERILKQKRLFLCTLKEAFRSFKEQQPDCEIGFSKFACLRPKEVVLAGASGTHAVCVCIIHQNMKLMISGAKLDNLKDLDSPSEDLTYKVLLEKMHCEASTAECHLNKCPNCPGPESLREKLRSIFQERMIEQLEYKQWTSTDRSKLLTVVQSSEDFIDSLLEALPDLSAHSYLAKQQSKFFKEAKQNLSPGEVIVVGDFSENYTFVVQDAVQGYHWTNDQATLHPFVAYYRQSAEEEPIALSLVVISDYMKHSTSAVYAFQDVLIKHLKEIVPSLKKIKYFSDGCAGQYKNRFNAANLLNHAADFGIEAEWHFFPTAHGKGPSDAAGGTFKREAAKASLQAVDAKQITTTEELFGWAKSFFDKLAVTYVKKEEVLEVVSKLEPRFATAAPVHQIRQQHCLVPMADNLMSVARDSFGAGYRVLDLHPVAPNARGKKRNSRTSDLAQADDPDGDLEQLEGWEEFPDLDKQTSGPSTSAASAVPATRSRRSRGRRGAASGEPRGVRGARRGSRGLSTQAQPNSGQQAQAQAQPRGESRPKRRRR